jgi:hypothetical protein
VRFWQYTAYSEKKRNYVFSANTRGETLRFRQKRGVKRCIFGDNAVFTKIRLYWRILLTILKYFEILALGPIYY